MRLILSLLFMKISAICGLLLALAVPVANAQTHSTTSVAQSRASYQFLQMTTIESIVPGGMGRSRVLFTPEFKGTKETPMENLFSLVGINLGNVHTNEETILSKY